MKDFRQEIKNAVATLKCGGTILYPTDTIWGIGCDATNSAAIEKVYLIKERTKAKAMIVLFEELEHIEKYASIPKELNEIMLQHTRPLTVIFPNVKGLPEILLADDKSLAIRKTNEAFSKSLIKQFGKPIVSSSANKSGQPFPKRFSDISTDIIEAADYVVSYGQDNKTPATPSKIIRQLSDNSLQLIRK